MNTLRFTLGLAACVSFGPALAGAGGGDATVTHGWYAAPMASYVLFDKQRCNIKNGIGATLAVGHRGEIAALEPWVELRSASQGGCTYTVPHTDPNTMQTTRVPVTESGGVKFGGAGLAIVFTPFHDGALSRVFGLGGIGLQQFKNYPQYGDGKAIFADAGAGYLYPLSLFGREMSVRAEARYRYNFQVPPYPSADEQDPPPKHSFRDILFNVGLQIPFGSVQEVPPPPPEKVQVVPAAEPAPAPAEAAPEPAPAVAPATSESDSSAVIETAKAGDTIVLHGVTFNTGKSTLTSNAKTVLDDVAAKLGARPELNVEIGGHTDNRGNGDYNQHLSEKRAQSVLDYLVSKGVDAGRLSAQGYGLSQPVDTNDTDEGREHNRRVELKVIDAAAPPAAPAAGAH